MIRRFERRLRLSLAATFSAAVAALALAGCGGKKGTEPTLSQLNPAEFPVAGLEVGPFEVAIEEVGVLEAAKKTTILAPFEAKVSFILADGAKVKEGDPLVRFDVEQVVDDLRERINNLKITKADIETSVERLEQQMRESTLDYERSLANLEFDRAKLMELNQDIETLETLAELSLVPQSEVDSGVASMQSSRLSAYGSDLDFRKTSASTASSERVQLGKLGSLGYRARRSVRWVERLQGRLAQAELTAPVAGTWTVARTWNWQAQRKQPVAEGQEVHDGHLIGEIDVEAGYRVRSQVSESKISLVSAGSKARLSATALDSAQLDGEISFVGNTAIDRKQSPAGDQTESTDFSGLKVFEIEIAISNPEAAGDKLKGGITVDVSIVVERLEKVVSAPLRGVHREEGLPVVFVKTPSGIEKRRVTLGPRNRDRVVIQDGLAGDETIYLADLNKELDKLREAQSGGHL